MCLWSTTRALDHTRHVLQGGCSILQFFLSLFSAQPTTLTGLQRTLRARLEQLCLSLRRGSLSAVHRGVLSGIVMKLLDFREAVTGLITALSAGVPDADKLSPYTTPFDWTSRLRYTVSVRGRGGFHAASPHTLVP